MAGIQGRPWRTYKRADRYVVWQGTNMVTLEPGAYYWTAEHCPQSRNGRGRPDWHEQGKAATEQAALTQARSAIEAEWNSDHPRNYVSDMRAILARCAELRV